MLHLTPETDLSEPGRAGRLRRYGARLALQTLIWIALSVAIAAMLVVGGPYAWGDALRWSSVNWLPWALLTPGIFWLSHRFPVMRGHFARSAIIHVAACLACTFAVSSIAQRVPLVVSKPGVVYTIDNQRIEILSKEAVSTLPLSPPGQPAAPLLITPQTSGALPVTAMSGQILSPAVAFGIVSGGARAAPFGDGVRIDGPGFTHASGLPEPTWRMRLVPLAVRANVGFLIYVIVAAAAHAMTFYRHAKDRERQALALVASRNQAKLDALRLQLQPHFLFNALNAIATLVHRDARAADRLIGDLSDLLRASLQTTQHEVTLADELALLDHYLAIEEARLGDRLRIVRDIRHEALAACVPPLVLQPLAENAIRHGLEPRLQPGTITIEARREGDLLRLTVADDGVGLHTTSPRSSRRGIGVTNTRERLRTLHGDAARLDFSSPPAGGVRAEVVLPYRLTPRNNSGAATLPTALAP